MCSKHLQLRSEITTATSSTFIDLYNPEGINLMPTEVLVKAATSLVSLSSIRSSTALIPTIPTIPPLSLDTRPYGPVPDSLVSGPGSSISGIDRELQYPVSISE